LSAFGSLSIVSQILFIDKLDMVVHCDMYVTDYCLVNIGLLWRDAAVPGFQVPVEIHVNGRRWPLSKAQVCCVYVLVLLSIICCYSVILML